MTQWAKCPSTPICIFFIFQKNNPCIFKYATLQISITHNKKQNPLLHLLINCISANSVAEILPLKDEYIFRFSIFLIIGLCYNLAFSTNTRRVFIKTFLNHWGNSALIFIIFWIFSSIKCFIVNILSEAVLLGKCLRSP